MTEFKKKVTEVCRTENETTGHMIQEGDMTQDDQSQVTDQMSENMENQLHNTNADQCQLMSTDVNRCQQISMDINGYQLISVDVNGYQSMLIDVGRHHRRSLGR